MSYGETLTEFPQPPPPSPLANGQSLEREAPPPYAPREGDSEGQEEQPAELFFSTLPLDIGSFETLRPMYRTMPYNLAFYHLNCARLRVPAKNDTKFLDEISCSGTSAFEGSGLEYNWSSEVYFDKGELLQKEEIRFNYGPVLQMIQSTYAAAITRFSDAFIRSLATPHMGLQMPKCL
ncbi:hypothetical protein GGR57DRAFT_513610 [Xylariaceae sp. FL1272]|nr:hypothetical protein GGR57DRAFT_513610 [Xylariaceae sp. FL1272]